MYKALITMNNRPLYEVSRTRLEDIVVEVAEFSRKWATITRGKKGKKRS